MKKNGKPHAHSGEEDAVKNKNNRIVYVGGLKIGINLTGGCYMLVNYVAVHVLSF